MEGKVKFTGSVERAVHFIVLWIEGGVGVVHLVGRVLGQLGTVVVMTAVERAARTTWSRRLGGRRTPGIGGGFGPVDHCCMTRSVKSVLIMMLRSRRLHKGRLGRPRWSRRSRRRRLIIILRVKVKQTSSSETAVM